MRYNIMMRRRVMGVILGAFLLVAATLGGSPAAEAADDLGIGDGNGENESLTVTGNDSPLNANKITVGFGGGVGALNITGGGQVFAEGNIIVGGGDNNPSGGGGTGTLTVSGIGSELSSAGEITVGNYGTGVLKITDGGKMSAAAVYLERSGYGTGTLLLGAGSELRVAGGGGGQNLALFNGLLTGSGTIRLENGSNVTVNSGTISVGDRRGQIGELTIRGGDLRNNVNMYLRVDTAKDGSADHITIDGGAFSTTSQNQLKMIIDLSSLNSVVNAPVITATGGITGLPSNSVEFTLNGLALSNIGRVTGSASVEVTGNQLQLTTSFNAAQNEKMTWTGASDTVWNMTSENWTNSGSTIKKFLAGDWAVFDTSSPTVLSIEQAVNASRMDVTAGRWIFRDDLTVRGDFWVGTQNSDADGKLHVTGNDYAYVELHGDNIFSGGIEVAGDSRLIIEKNNAYQFNDALTGDALLAFRMHGNELSFGRGVGSAFTGTVALNNGDLAIDANAANALASATLRLDSGATATVDANRNLGGLNFNGGALDITAFDGSGHVGPDTVLSVNELKNDGGGTVTIDIASANGLKTGAADFDTMFDYADDDSLYQKKIIEANSVTGSGTTLNLQDASGKPLSSAQAVERIITYHTGDEVGKATFDYSASVGSDGIYLGYGLSRLEALADKTVYLAASGSTGDPKLTAKLTGTGGFNFSGNTNVAIGNTASDYTGATLIEDLTVTMLTNNALGKTSALILFDSATLNMNGKAQTVGLLEGHRDSSIDLGALTVDPDDADSTFDGKLTGHGSLIKEGNGTLELAGNNNYTGDTVINGGALKLSAGSLNSTRLAMGGGSTLDFSSPTAADLTSFERLDVQGTGVSISGGANTLDLRGETIAFDLAGVSAGQTMLDAHNSLDVEGANLELKGLDGLTLNNGDRLTLMENVLGLLANLDSFTSNSGRRSFTAAQENGSVYIQVALRSFLNSQSALPGHLNNANLIAGARHLDWLADRGYDMAAFESLWDQSMNLGGRQAAIALEQMYGGYAAYANAGLQATGSQFRSLLQGRHASRLLGQQLFGQPAYGAQPASSRLWASGFASQAEQKAAENISGYEWEARGLALGYEYSVSERFQLGFGAALSKGEFSIANLRYENTPDVLNLALYGLYTHPGGFFAQGGLGYGHAWNDYEVDMLLGGIKSGEYGSDDLSANLELGYALKLPQNVNLIPSVGLEYSHMSNNGWTEAISGNPRLLASRFDSQSNDSLAIPLALRVNKLFHIGSNCYILPELHAAYVYQREDSSPTINSGYAPTPGSAPMTGVKPGRNHWRFGAGLESRLNEGVDLRLDYDFDTRSGFQGHNVMATIGVAF